MDRIAGPAPRARGRDAPGSRVLILPTASAAGGRRRLRHVGEQGLATTTTLWAIAARGPAAQDARGRRAPRVRGGPRRRGDGVLLGRQPRLPRRHPAGHAVLGGPEGGGGARDRVRGLQRGHRLPRRRGARQRARDAGRTSWQPGLRLFPRLRFGPHWDALDGFAPGLPTSSSPPCPTGATLVAVDENTAMVGDGTAWDVEGVGGAHILHAGAWHHHGSGSRFDLPMLP